MKLCICFGISLSSKWFRLRLIFHLRLQQYVNRDLPDVQTGLRKANKLPTSVGSLKKQESSRKTPSSVVSVAQSCLTLCDPTDSSLPGSSVHGICFIDYTKAFDCVDHNKLWKILKEMGIPDHLTCLLRNLYAGQKVTVRTGHGTTDWFQIRKGVHQGCILSPCLFMLSTSWETLD